MNLYEFLFSHDTQYPFQETSLNISIDQFPKFIVLIINLSYDLILGNIVLFLSLELLHLFFLDGEVDIERRVRDIIQILF